MADENLSNQNADEIQKQNQETESQKRIKQLSEKVRLTSEERDEKTKLVEERDVTIKGLQQENAFNSGFTDVVTTYPSSLEYKDKIKEKVLAGYTVKDAAFAVLGEAGKLGGQVAPRPAPEVAGGSATTNVTGTGQKNISEMTQAEKREQLSKDLTWT